MPVQPRNNLAHPVTGIVSLGTEPCRDLNCSRCSFHWYHFESRAIFALYICLSGFNYPTRVKFKKRCSIAATPIGLQLSLIVAKAMPKRNLHEGLSQISSWGERAQRQETRCMWIGTWKREFLELAIHGSWIRILRPWISPLRAFLSSVLGLHTWSVNLTSSWREGQYRCWVHPTCSWACLSPKGPNARMYMISMIKWMSKQYYTVTWRIKFFNVKVSH